MIPTRSLAHGTHPAFADLWPSYTVIGVGGLLLIAAVVIIRAADSKDEEGGLGCLAIITASLGMYVVWLGVEAVLKAMQEG